MARWHRADRALKTATLLAIDDPEAAVSRAYYAVFYAVTAYFALEGRTFAKHQAVEQAVHRDLVKPGLITGDLGGEYSALFSLRASADYAMDSAVTPEDAQDAAKRAQTFIDAIRKLRPELDAQLSTERPSGAG